MFDPWVGKIPWRKEWLTTLVLLPGILWTKEPGELQSMEPQRVGHNWETDMHRYTHIYNIDRHRYLYILHISIPIFIYLFIPILLYLYPSIYLS